MDDLLDTFLRAALVPRKGSHAGGDLAEAEQLRAALPELARQSPYAAAVLGDDATLAAALRDDPALATARGGPYGWDLLLHLAFSRYLRLDSSRSGGFVRAATLLLEAGADPNTGWWEKEEEPKQGWEAAIYGAAGLAHHAGVSRVLLAHGADPNDGETSYHIVEGPDHEVLKVVLGSGRFNADSLAAVLLRQADWHDPDGMRLALAAGGDPDRMTVWGYTALHQALRRDNDLEAIALLLDGGADPLRPGRDSWTSPMIAAHRGRGDVLALLEQRGVSLVFDSGWELLAACARGDRATVDRLRDMPISAVFVAHGGATVLGQFAGVGNTAGVECLLSLGVPVDARNHGDGYFELASGGTALHTAAWRSRPETVVALLRHGADVHARNEAGKTPLQLAVAAATESWWRWRRTPESVIALLAAGASTEGIALPTGYAAIDAVLQR